MATKHAPFTVLKGGLDETVGHGPKVFRSAFVTDTRLMGVVGLHVHWTLPDNEVNTELHQFFYFDAEEYGLDTYESVLIADDEESNDLEILREEEENLFGGLGGVKVPLNEREVRLLVQEYVELTISLGLELPGDTSEYAFLLSPRLEPDQAERDALMAKQCTTIDSPYQVINYFLMRCFCKDRTAAKFLTKHYVRTDLFPDLKPATLFKNTIDPAPDPTSGMNTDYYATSADADFGTFQTHTAYLCESLIATDDAYSLVVTQVTLDHLQVVRFERISCFRVSETEAAMMLTKPEYVTVFDVVEDAPPFMHNTTAMSRRSMMSFHDNGTLFMVFHPHNDHVSRREFFLNEDVQGTYYATDFGQLILSSFSEPGIQALERDLFRSNYFRYVEIAGRYQFPDPVLYEFISGDYEDFLDFVEQMMEGEPPDGPD